MGLFSKTVLHQATMTQSLVEDTPKVIEPTVLTAILDGSEIVPNVLNGINSCYAQNVKQYWRYGRDNFTNGLPEGSIGTYVIDRGELQIPIDTIYPPPEGGSNRLDIVNYGMYDFVGFFNEITRNDGFDPKAISFQKDPVDGNAVAISPIPPRAGRQSENELFYNVYFFSPLDDDMFEMIKRTEVRQTRYPMVDGRYYYYVEFQQLDKDGNESGLPMYFVYDPLSNEFPNVKPPRDTPDTLYMPVVPLRINNVTLTDDKHKDTELYKTSKKLLDKMELNIEQLHEGVNESPDIGQVDHAYVVLGINIHTDKQESMEYMFRFFDDMMDKARTSKEEFELWDAQPDPDDDFFDISAPPVNSIKISDGTYSTEILFNYIDKESKAGSFGKEGSYRVLFSPYNYRVSKGNYSYQSSQNTMTIEEQTAPNQITRIIVAGGIFYNNISGAAQYGNDYTKNDENNFLIPINLDVYNSMGILKRNAVAYDSLKIVLQAYEYQKLKWYETGFFKFVVIVVAIVITVYTGIDFINGALGAFAAGGALGLVIYVTVYIVVSVAIDATFKFAVEKLGLKGVLAVAAAMVIAGQFGELFQLPWANVIAFIGSRGIASSLAAQTDILQDQFQEFSAYAEVKTQELNEAMEYMKETASKNMGNLLDPTRLWTDIGMFPMESPSDFIDRSLSLGNRDSVVDSISNFYDTNLLLPTPLSYQ